MQCGKEFVAVILTICFWPVAEARRLSAGRSAGHEHQAASNWVQGRFERRYT